MRPFCLLLLTTLSFAGCTQFPELEQSVSPEVARQPYPALKPQDDLIATANASETEEEELREELAERSASLGARAEALRAQPEGAF